MILAMLNQRWMFKSTKHKNLGFIMVWGCLTANSEGDLIRINGIMNTEKYRQILIHLAISSCRRLIGNRFLKKKNSFSTLTNVMNKYRSKLVVQREVHVSLTDNLCSLSLSLSY